MSFYVIIRKTGEILAEVESLTAGYELIDSYEYNDHLDMCYTSEYYAVLEVEENGR